MNNRIVITGLAAMTFLASMSENPKDTVRLKEVVVTAPSKSNPELIPLDVTTVTATEINESAEVSLLPVLMNRVPGMFVTERGYGGYGVSTGSAGTVTIRGIGNSNEVLFMIDGQPQWAGIFGHALSDTYVANGVEKVEVVKGPSSLLYGSNAMGGSVNIITKTQKEDGLTGRARAMFGSYTTQNFALTTGFKKGSFSATVSGQLDRSNGYQPRSSYWLANEFVQLKYGITRNWSIGGMLDMTQGLLNNPGTIQSPLENMWTDISRGTGSIYVKNEYDKVDGGIQAYINWGKHKVDDGNAPGSAPRDYLFNSTDRNMGFTMYESMYFWQGNIMTAGVDFQHWGGHNWNTNKDDVTARSSEETHYVNEISGYLMMQQGFFKDLLNVNAGVRLQHGSTYGNVWVPQAGFIVKPGYDSQIKVSFSKGFRSPTIKELYLFPPKNPDLKPEYMYNYEVSYRQYFLDRRIMAGAALYYIDAKNIILTVPVEGRMRNMNTGKMHNKGIELEASWRILKNLEAYGSWAYLHSDSSTDYYAPKNKMNWEVTYMPGAFSLTLEEMSIWGMKNTNPTGESVNYSLLNLRAAYTLGRKVPVTLFVKADNITNKHYEIMYGCPMPGTTLKGGLEVAF